MPSVADTLLSQGTTALRSVHGEQLTRRPASELTPTEFGEVITDENGKGIPTGETSETFTCNWFDEFYLEPSPDGISIATLRPACEVSDSELSSIARNDVITRNGVDYYVNAIKPDGFGNNLLLLTKHVH